MPIAKADNRIVMDLWGVAVGERWTPIAFESIAGLRGEQLRPSAMPWYLTDLPIVNAAVADIFRLHASDDIELLSVIVDGDPTWRLVHCTRVVHGALDLSTSDFEWFPPPDDGKIMSLRTPVVRASALEGSAMARLEEFPRMVVYRGDLVEALQDLRSQFLEVREARA